MGVKNFRNFKPSGGQLTGAPDKRVQAAAETGAGNKAAGNNSNTSTADTKGKGRAGTADTGTAGTAAGTAAGAGKTEAEKKPTPVAIIEPPTSAELTKPKRKRKASAKKKDTGNAEQISALIQSVSMIAASREGLEHWAISKKEADSIAEPLNNILENTEAFNKLAEHSDAIALCVASASVFIPRVMVQIEKNKETPKSKKAEKTRTLEGKQIHTVKKEVRQNDENRKTGDSNRRNDGKPTAVSVADSLDIPPSVFSIM